MSRLRKDDSGVGGNTLKLIAGVTGIVQLMVVTLVLFVILAILGIVFHILVLMMAFMVVIFIIILLIVVSIRQPAGKKWIMVSASIVMILVVVAGMFAGWFGKFELAPVDFNTTSWSNVDMPNHLNIYAQGYYDDPDGYHQGKGGEYLDAVGYTTSWRSGGLPEKVYWTGSYCVDDNAGLQPLASLLHVRFTDSGTWPSEPIVIEVPHQATALCSTGGATVGPILINIPTEFKNGWMKVDWHLLWETGDYPYYKYSTYFAASDMAEIRDGIGLITKPVELAKVEVGKPFDIEFRLGSACASSDVGDGHTLAQGGGWSYVIYSEGQAKQVDGGDLGCGGTTVPQYKTVSYTPTSEDFNPSNGECKTKLRIELYSSFFQKDKVSVRTLDLTRAFALPRPTLTLSSYNAHVGDSITATVEPGAGFQHDWVVKHEDGTIVYEETNNNTDVKFTVPKAGMYTVSVNCIASDCSVSDPDSKKLIVLEAGKEGGGLDPNLLPLIILIIILVAEIVILALVPIHRLWLKALLITLVTLITIGIAWWLGVF